MSSTIESAFRKMGARVKVQTTDRFNVRIDVLRDREGEYFVVRHRSSLRVDVPQVTEWNRHLLLTVAGGTADVSTFLCGRDEQHWFVAAIPEAANARTVQEAKDALKPEEVWSSIERHCLQPERYDNRSNEAFVRQGEWFFIPAPELKVDEDEILRHEPIRRGAGKPHWCQFLYRIGGEAVFVSTMAPNGLTRKEYKALAPEVRKRVPWQRMVRDARVFVRGTVEHVDHKTIYLMQWHQVVMNTELQARAMEHMAFLD
jgi:hypothetical protein